MAGLIVLRADSAYYNHGVIAAARRAGARFSVTARLDPAVRTAIAQIGDDGWTPIHYPHAVWDEGEQRLISDAEVAETEFTAFTSRRTTEHITGRLIGRRVKRLSSNTVPARQDELFATWRHHAVFSDSPMTLLQAETDHRQHAIVEQVIADLKSGALAHLPSGKFTANAAWLVLAAIAYNLTRAAGTLASPWHARATGATIRRHLISVPARLARSARRIYLHHELTRHPGRPAQTRRKTWKSRTNPATLSRLPTRPPRRRSTSSTETINIIQTVDPGSDGLVEKSPTGRPTGE